MINQSSEKSTVLITGASGFVGYHLVRELREVCGYHIRVAARTSSISMFNNHEEVIPIPNICVTTDWEDALKNCEVVIHTAARVHVMHENSRNPLHEFRQVNVDGTLNLARQAVKHGVKRFIFISSIKVNGEETVSGKVYNCDDSPAPQDPYSVSKSEAEQGLLALSLETNLEVVIIRPTIIYGPGVKGNFQRMIFWIHKGYPLPLRSVINKRSFVSIYNLVDLIIKCIGHPRAANQIFLVSDGDDLSTRELLLKTGKAMNKPVRLITIPYWILNGVAKMVGKQMMLRRLCGSLQVDISKTRELLDWSPKINTDEALRRTLNDLYLLDKS